MPSRLKRRIALLAGILIIAALTYAGALAINTRKERENLQQVWTTVESFGAALKQVSTLAPTEIVVSDMDRLYSGFVAPELLLYWKQNIDKAPGRKTSSPWPDSIVISKAERQGAVFNVEGLVRYATTDGVVLTAPVLLLVEERDGAFYIISFEEQEAALAQSPNANHTYTETDFTITYPDLFTLSTSSPRDETYWSSLATTSGEILVTLLLPRSHASGTNFSEAWVTVGTSTHTDAIRTCTQQPSYMPQTAKQINGTPFAIVQSDDAGAGNYYRTKSYRTLRNGICYAVESVLHWTNIQNYPPGTVAEFDAKTTEALLESVIDSFRFM